MRTGAEYLRSLNDGRRVFVDGERVKDVTAHPAFRQAARSIAGLYDIAAEPALRERMTFASPKTGEPVWRAWQIPQHPRRPARAPTVLGDLGGSDLRPDGPHARSRRGLLRRLRGDAAVLRAPAASRNSPTTSSRSTNSCATITSTAATRSCRRRSTARSRRTSRAIRRSMPAWSRSATTASSFPARSSSRPAAPMSDYIHLSCIQPLQPGDENYANCLAVPVAAEGVKLYPRRPFARAGSGVRLSAVEPVRRIRRYVVFDNVFVPWERVFIYRNVELSRDQWCKTPSHCLRQSPGAGALRHQAALHGGPRAAHERDDRQRRAAAGADHDGRARRAGVDLRSDAARARDRGADRGRRAVAVGRHALFGDGAAVGTQRPDAGNHPRTGRRGLHHAAVVGSRFRQSGNRRRPRALHALGVVRREDARQADAADLGFPRLRIRQPPRAIRKILRRRARSW